MVEVHQVKNLETYYFGGEYHDTNEITMHEFLEEHIPVGSEIIEHDGTFAVIEIDGERFGCHASGDGDSYNHKIEFEMSE